MKPDRNDAMVVVVNTRSRRGRDAVGEIEPLFARHGVAMEALLPADDHAHLQRLVERAVKGGARRVAVGGGDGTMTSAVGAFAHRKAVMGVLPLGTGNSFAQTLGLDPHDLDAAVATIAGGVVAKVDLGRCNDRYFANFATIGTSSDIAESTPRPLKDAAGKVAYALTAVLPILRGRPFRARIRWKHGRCTVHTRDLVVAVGRYFGSTPITPDANDHDGRLALVAIEGGSALALVRDYAAWGAHAQTRQAGAHVIRARRVRIRTDRAQRVALDGSAAGRTPVELRVARGALRVYVPAGVRP